MFDLDSMMRQAVEPIKVRKRPSFWKRIFSWVLPIPQEKRKSSKGVELQVLAWQGKFVLDTGKVNYSFGSLHDVMVGSIKDIVAWGVQAERVLMLGYGGGSAAEIVHQDINREAEIIGVEWDDAVIDLAKKYFYIQGVRLLHDDAVDYVFRAAKQSWEYDLIVCDLFTETKVASAVLEGDFLESLSKLLGNKGGVIINTMLKKEESVLFLGELKKRFNHVKTWDGMKGNAVFLCKMGGIA
ncbi:MAG: hypothetical protein RL233_1534 [Bacteroidota bacterium]